MWGCYEFQLDRGHAHAIPRGDETDRLLRWGYRHYREMFNDRQLLGLELSCRAIERTPSGVVRDALRTNLSDPQVQE